MSALSFLQEGNRLKEILEEQNQGLAEKGPEISILGLGEGKVQTGFRDVP